MSEKEDIEKSKFEFINQIKVRNQSQNHSQSSSHLSQIVTSTVVPKKECPAIFKLSVDCFHEIFDLLSQADLIAIGQTCKRMQQIAGEFVNFSYAAKTARADDDGVYISSMKSNIFCRYIQKISISGDRLNAYRFVARNCTESIKHFRAYGTLPEGGFECIKEILKGVEVLEMNDCFIKGEFYNEFLKYCPNIKSLSVSRSSRNKDKSVIIGSGNEWMLRKYTLLENVELIEIYGLQTNELKVFFQQNSIQNLSIDSRGLWENRHAIMESNTKFDTLAVDIYQSIVFDCKNQPISMIDCIYHLLQELYKRGVFQKLHLYMVFINQKYVRKFYSLNGIEMLNGDIVKIDRILVGVKVFSVWCGDEILEIEHLPTKLPDLERVYFLKTTSDRILPFIRYSVKLKQIKIKQLKDIACIKFLDLIALNKQRKKLFGARKITIYVKEDLYLATKWAMKTTNFHLIELKRFDSAEWEEFNSRAKYLKSF